MSELWRLNASELAARVRNKEVSAREVAIDGLERLSAANPAIAPDSTSPLPAVPRPGPPAALARRSLAKTPASAAAIVRPGPDQSRVVRPAIEPISNRELPAPATAAGAGRVCRCAHAPARAAQTRHTRHPDRGLFATHASQRCLVLCLTSGAPGRPGITPACHCGGASQKGSAQHAAAGCFHEAGVDEFGHSVLPDFIFCL